MRFPDDWPEGYTMDKWLERTYALQEECFEGNPAELNTEDKIDFVRRMTLGLIVEATEALDVVSHWKWWHDKDDAPFNKELYIEELVDIMHFVGAMACMTGINDREWAAAYARKSAIVRQRAGARHEGSRRPPKAAGAPSEKPGGIR